MHAQPVELDAASGFPTGQAILKPRKAQPFFNRHPWVFDSAIAELIGEPEDGAVIDLLSEKQRFIARGIFNRQSRLRVRLYCWDPAVPLDAAFWQARLSAAIATRRAIGYLAPGRACRLVFSEADGISGIVVDQYGDYLVIQINSRAMAVRRDELMGQLAELLHPRGILIRSEKGIAREEGIEVAQGLAWGTAPEGPIFIEEHGLQYGIDLLTGQKTGCYLDQVENRAAAARYLRGRRVLDLFCYTGGFSLSAAKLGGAREVLGIDSSERAIATARANAELNGLPNVQFRVADCFQALEEFVAEGTRFDAVILDPPKFTRSRHNVDEALRAYHRINRLAVELLEPGGILVTCSCSGSVSRDDFAKGLAVVAQRSGREIQIFEQRGASPDHPVRPTCPESEYLKCFICGVL